MAAQADLIDFDIIETHKENIQSLPGGRSARALVNILSPVPSGKPASPCDSDTRTLNDAIRQEYEIELQSINESDDPLDIFDRYVKWTLNAYPSAQATPQSQLLPLLERATKAFLSSSHYKNDPRYLKLWLHYIRLFSDAPRETFAFLARHKIGEGLALYYEEFAAWLESAGRWNQAEEVYKLGIEKEARPTERLMRKFAQFQQRFEQRPQDANEPSSPALPTVRPALAARVDPFASSAPRSSDPQAPRVNTGLGGSTSRSGKPKMAIFSDTDGAPAEQEFGAQTKGWESIGSLKDRKKENTLEARSWAGETLKAGKKTGHVQKIEVFKDSLSQAQDSIPFQSSHPDQAVINPKTGKPERVFVNLDAVYPNRKNQLLEMSFEELRAARRGWTSKTWSRQSPKRLKEATGNGQIQKQEKSSIEIFRDSPDITALTQDLKDKACLDENSTRREESVESKQIHVDRPPKTKRLKVREVSQATQTIKLKMDSPTGRKVRRKASAEPTMTFHSRAATDEIYSIFNQPLKCEADAAAEDTVSVAGESEGDYEDDEDDYTSAGESTCTGRISEATSEFGEEETTNSTRLSIGNAEDNNTQAQSISGDGASEWTEFTVPKLEKKSHDDLTTNTDATEQTESDEEQSRRTDIEDKQDTQELVTPVSPESREVSYPTRYIPVSPEEHKPPTNPYRNPYQIAQNRLPFMTPIVEKTESSLGTSTAAALHEKDYFTSKTPSRSKNVPQSPEIQNRVNDLLLSSPFQDMTTPERKKKLMADAQDDQASPAKKLKLVIERSPQAAKVAKGPVIQELQVNPVDETVRLTIMSSLYPPLSSYAGYHDHSGEVSNRSNEMRKYVKTQSEKKSKGNAERTQTSVMPPILRLPGSDKVYAVKRELGKGAFAPVYLLESIPADENDVTDGNELVALKMEDPPTSWEFLMIRTLRSRLGASARTTQSLIQAQEFHLYRDECFLMLDFSDQGTLLDLVNLFRADNVRNGKSSDAGLDEVLAMFFSVELFRIIEDCHKNGIIHGDLKADNCLLRLQDGPLDGPYDPHGHDGWSSKGLTLIDFGRSIDVRKFNPKAQFIADWETGPQDCVEMRELRPWTYQADYSGIAGVIHSLLFGKYIDTVVDKAANNNNNSLSGFDVSGPVGAKKVYKLREGFKRYWQGEIWSEVFHLLLNPTLVPDDEASAANTSTGASVPAQYEKMPLHKGMKRTRERMEEWLKSEGERKGLRTLVGKAERMVKEKNVAMARRR